MHRSLIWRMGSFLLSLAPRSCKQSSQGHIRSCLRQDWEVGGMRAASMLTAQIDQNYLQFTIQAFPWKLQAFNRLQTSKIVTKDRFCQCNCDLDEKIDSYSAIFLEFLPHCLLYIRFYWNLFPHRSFIHCILLFSQYNGRVEWLWHRLYTLQSQKCLPFNHLEKFANHYRGIVHVRYKN
jgi:hypothetical protein